MVEGAAAVVFGWFVGIDGPAMYIAGFLNIGAATVRLAYFCRCDDF